MTKMTENSRSQPILLAFRFSEPLAVNLSAINMGRWIEFITTFDLGHPEPKREFTKAGAAPRNLRSATILLRFLARHFRRN